jgi:RIO-like serine/threonine protein kinase
MTVTRLSVLEELTAVTDAERQETVTLDALAGRFEADREVVEGHVERLVACDLARFQPEQGVRVTITGEELLAIDADDPVIVDPSPDED